MTSASTESTSIATVLEAPKQAINYIVAFIDYLFRVFTAALIEFDFSI
jgi:hypothetical protein